MNKRNLWTAAVNLAFGAAAFIWRDLDIVGPGLSAVYLMSFGMFFEQLWQEAIKH